MNARAPALKYTVGRTLTPKEEAQRASAFACLADDKAGDCTKVMWTSIFFDGTNNNLERDKLDNSYSNIVVLYNTHKNKEQGDYYPYYIPGVGTPCPQIGEEQGTIFRQSVSTWLDSVWSELSQTPALW